MVFLIYWIFPANPVLKYMFNNIIYRSTHLKNYYHSGYFQNSRIQIIYKYNLIPVIYSYNYAFRIIKIIRSRIFFMCRYLTHHFFIYLFINTSTLMLNKIGFLRTFQRNNLKMSKSSLPVVQTMSNETTRLLCLSVDVYQSYKISVAYLPNNVK